MFLKECDTAEVQSRQQKFAICQRKEIHAHRTQAIWGFLKHSFVFLYFNYRYKTLLIQIENRNSNIKLILNQNSYKTRTKVIHSNVSQVLIRPKYLRYKRKPLISYLISCQFFSFLRLAFVEFYFSKFVYKYMC